MDNEKIQTLHPVPGKLNKSISTAKYEYIKKHLTAILATSDFTHTDLMEQLYTRVQHEFKGGVQWYGEVVKLDLEARNVIERIRSKPDKYRLKK